MIEDAGDGDSGREASNVVDLMAALKQSLEKPGKKAAGKKAAPAKKAPAKKAAAKKRA